jgi:predicted metal-dependent enzyme (double-stranded beta helix superfamily)
MQNHEDKFFLRDYGTRVNELFEAYRDDRTGLVDKLLEVTQSLLKRPDMLNYGVARKGNHLKNSKWLYYDGHLEVTLTEYTTNKQIPVHDHGNAEALIVYCGRVKHCLYERVDAGDIEGYADVRILEERILQRGDIVLVAPPLDIHSFIGLDDNTFVIAVADGAYKLDRHYYNTENKTYVVQTPKAMQTPNAA